MPRDRRTNLLPWAICGILALMLAVTSWRVIDLDAQVSDARSERDTIAAQLLDAQTEAGATAYRLATTPAGPGNASGTAFMPDSGSGILAVVNLPTAAQGTTWQIWYFRSDTEPPVPGPTFAIDDAGIGYSLIPADVGEIRGLGVSIEPEGGSTAPTSPMSLQGTATQGARG